MGMDYQRKLEGKDNRRTQVKEVGETAGYTTSYSEDTFTITNSHACRKDKCIRN